MIPARRWLPMVLLVGLVGGYALVGVIPDANGLGKPDIMMAKRVGR